MDVVVWWVVAVVGALIIALAGAAEGALGATPSSNGRGRSVEQAKQWSTLVVLNVIGPIALVVAAGALVQRSGEASLWAVGGTVLTTIVLAVVLRLTGLAWGTRSHDLLKGSVGSLLRVLAWLGWPARAFMRAAGPVMSGDDETNGGRLSGEAIRALVQGDDDVSPIEDEEMEMITGIIELGDTRVREVMVPRIDIVAIPCKSSLDDALDTIIGDGHSSIPVYEDSVDDIKGLLYAKDLLRAFRERDFAPDLKGLLRDPYYVPQTKPVDVLLEELQNRKVHMAIVVDEYGGTAGLVTIEDLIEEIVGEIQDEYDTELPRIESSTDDEVVCLAGVTIDEVNDMLGVEMSTESADTLGGLVFASLGRVPESNERVTFDDAEIHVLELDGRRIHRVRVRRRDALAPVGEAGDGGSETDMEAVAQ
jgi:putative hemolysin